MFCILRFKFVLCYCLTCSNVCICINRKISVMILTKPSSQACSTWIVLREATLLPVLKTFQWSFRSLTDPLFGWPSSCVLHRYIFPPWDGLGWNVRVTSRSIDGVEVAIHVSLDIESSEIVVKGGFASRSDMRKILRHGFGLPSYV